MVFSKINKEYTQIKMIDDVCSICLDEFKETNICKTECGHVFHLTCMLTHYDNKCKTLDCPMCRKELHEKKIIIILLIILILQIDLKDIIILLLQIQLKI